MPTFYPSSRAEAAWRASSRRTSNADRCRNERVRFHVLVADRSDQLRDLLDATLVTPRREVVDDRDEGRGIAKPGVADADGRCAREHVFDHVLGLGYAADPD